jgi:transcriptional regulator with XRE-family HTH domain
MIDLQRYRKVKKLDQKHISVISGLDQAIISKYENKKMVTEHITNMLLKAIPELDSYMINENDSIASEPQEKYETPSIRIIETITNSNQNLSASNRILVDTNRHLTDTNSRLQDQLIKINEKLLRFIDLKELV